MCARAATRADLQKAGQCTSASSLRTRGRAAVRRADAGRRDAEGACAGVAACRAGVRRARARARTAAAAVERAARGEACVATRTIVCPRRWYTPTCAAANLS